MKLYWVHLGLIPVTDTENSFNNFNYLKSEREKQWIETNERATE